MDFDGLPIGEKTEKPAYLSVFSKSGNSKLRLFQYVLLIGAKRRKNVETDRALYFSFTSPLSEASFTKENFKLLENGSDVRLLSYTH